MGPSLERQGFVVLGFPRSGTTLLRRLLDAHAEISCPPETNLLSACGRFLQEEPSVGGLPIGVLPGLAFSDVDEDEVLGRLRELVFGIHRAIAAKAGKRIWAEKTAFDIFHLDKIERLLRGHCGFICIHRHPLDVIVSVKELCDGMDQILPELHVYVRQYQSLYDAFAQAWIDCNIALNGFIARNAQDCCCVSYEALLQQPEETIGKLFSFMGVASGGSGFVERLFEQGSKVGLGDWKTYEQGAIDPGRTERWRSLPDSTIARLTPRLAPVADALGYSLPSVADTPAREESIRRYRLSKFVKQLQAKAGCDRVP